MKICSVCKNEFDTVDDLETHKCIWFCECCCLSFHKKQIFERHMKSSRHKQNVAIDSNDLQCNFCSKVLATRQSKNRHTSKCKLNKDLSKYLVHNKCIICQRDMSISSHIEKCKHINEHNITDENVNILRDSLSNHLNTTHNTVYNINNPSNCNIGNVTNNIVIFGNEDFSHINQSDIQQALKTKSVLPTLCRLMRSNTLYPENRNIKVTDFSRGKTQVFTEHGWEKAQPIDTFNNMIMEASDILDYKSNDNNLNFVELNKVESITDNVHELDMALDRGEDTVWGKTNRREIMMEFV